MAFGWEEALVGGALPVAGGVLTFMATAGLMAIRERSKRKEEYEKLHRLVYELVDDVMAEADQLASAEAVMKGGIPVMNPWAMTNDYWTMVKTRYAELSPSPNEVHEISKFFQYATEISNITRTMIAVGWNRGRVDPNFSNPSWTTAQRVIRNLRDRMEAQASRLRSAYFHPSGMPIAVVKEPSKSPKSP